MIFFGFKKPMTWAQQEEMVGRTYYARCNLKGLGANPSLEDFYLSTKGHAAQIRDVATSNFQLLDMDARKIQQVEGYPKNIGFGKLRKMTLKDRSKVAVINLGTTYGDVMHASRAMYFLGAKYPGMEFYVYQIIPDKTRMIYEKCPFVKGIYTLPCSLGNFKKFDYYIDLSGVTGLPGFSVLPLMDFYLGAFSLNKDEVPLKYKRMSLPFKPAPIVRDKPTLLFHHLSSARIRSMPEQIAKKLICGLLDEYHVVSAIDWDFAADGYTNLSKETGSFQSFSSLIGGVNAVVTVDTCAFHIADAYNIPCVAIFTSVDSKLRTKYYPRVQSIMLEKPSGQIYGKHMSTIEEDIEYSNSLWESLSIDDIKRLLSLANQDRPL